MSELLRIALVAEGPTDGVVIESALRAMLGERPFILKQIFPEGSMGFGAMGTGWVGVYRWCHQSARRGKGRLEQDALVFQNYDLLVLHLDADVAGFRYEDGSLTAESADCPLPCEQPCPPPSASVDSLRRVLLSWCGEASVPPKTVICMPSKSTEAWVLAMLFPSDLAMKQGIECHEDAESRLAQQPKAQRVRKKKGDYLARTEFFVAEWPRVAGPGALTQAQRFQSEFLAAVATA